MSNKMSVELDKIFYWGQLVLFGLLCWLTWTVFDNRRKSSSFKFKEFERKSNAVHIMDEEKTDPQKVLPGIRIDAPPHEILGIPKNSSRPAIRKAYKELMKRFHPDKIAPIESSAWKDAQKIAIAINEAKEKMLKFID